MKTSLLFITLISLSFVALTGFQCGSTEMTSAKLYIQRADWPNAEKSLMQEVEKNPNNGEAWYRLGHVRYQLKNYAGMNEACSRSLGVSNEFASDIKMLRLSAWAHLYNTGVDALVKAREAQGDSVVILNRKAVENFEQALVVNRDSASTYLYLGLAYAALDEFDKEALNLEIAVRKTKDPTIARTLASGYINRARKSSQPAEKQNNYTKAIAVLNDARQWAPHDEDLISLLLEAYASSGRTNEAMATFSEAARTNPSNKIYRYNYGVLLLKAGEQEAGIEEFKGALNIDPQFEDALYNIGIAYLQWGARMRSEAEANAKDGGKSNPVDKSYEQKFQLGKQYLEQLRDLKPDDVQVWEALGQAYANLNMQKQASEAFSKADALKNQK
jgi:tetratricopeptide (TPR) repeat protein